MLALVQWMNPQWGWVLPAAVLLPLCAHLMSKRSGKLTLFPTVRFVQKVIALQSRWYTPRHWLMLLLRMLILALVIGAMARPVWWADETLASQNHQGIAAVLILDASASMQRQEQGSSLFEIARQQVMNALSTLDPSRDRAMVIVMNAAPKPMLPRMSANFSAMRDELRTLKPTWEKGDLTAALSLASQPSWDSGDHVATAPLTIHLFSDMQQTQWPNDAQLRSLLADKTFVTHPIGQLATTLAHGSAKAAQGNLALHDARVIPALPVLGQMASVEVEVANYNSDKTSERVTADVVMTVQGKEQVRRVSIAAGRKVRINFPWRPASLDPVYIGLKLQPVGAASLADDTMKADNQTGRFVHVASARQVALVSAADVDDPATGAYYLKRALAPQNDSAANDVKLLRWTPAMVTTKLSPALQSQWPACVVMVQTGGLSEDVQNALATYMKQGGGVWWIIDSQGAADSLAHWQMKPDANDVAEEGEGTAGHVSPVLSLAGADTPLQQINRVDGVPYIGSGAYDRPELSVFDGPARAALKDVYFQTTVEGRLAPQATGLLFFAHLLPGRGGADATDGTADFNPHPPLLAYQNIGNGRLMVWTADLVPDAGSLVKSPVFLPLVHQMVRGLSPKLGATPNPEVGSQVTLSLSPPNPLDGVYVQQPDGSRVQGLAVVSGDLNHASATTLTLPSLLQPGPYGVHAQSDSRLLDGVQVEIASSESDLSPYLPLAADGASPSDASSSATNPQKQNAVASPDEPATALRQNGLALWPYLVLLAAAMLSLEALLGGAGSGKRELTHASRPDKTTEAMDA